MVPLLIGPFRPVALIGDFNARQVFSEHLVEGLVIVAAPRWYDFVLPDVAHLVPLHDV